MRKEPICNYTRLIKDDKIYSVDNCTDLFEKLDIKIIKKNHKEYINAAISFDIETSSFFDNETLSKTAVMYIWQVCFSGGIIIGRTWPEFINLLYIIKNYYELSDDRRLTIYVHNLAYEFQFIRKWLKWKSVFALEERKVVKAESEWGIDFKCSYILTNKSLQKIAEDLPEEFNGIAKLTGELDYRVIRTPATPLTKEELQYCINDVLIVVYFIYDKLINENHIANIPLTATGYVRKAVRANCLYNKEDYARSWYYKKYIRGLTLTVDDYKMLQLAFQGGFTHASCLESGKTVEDVGSGDLISAYPGEIVKNKFPASPFRTVTVRNRDEFIMYLSRYACLFYLELFNVKSSVIYEHIISVSRCIICEGELVDNGRIVEAEHIMICVNEIDFEVISKFYSWEKMRIGSFRIAYKQYLPTLLVQSVLEFYQLKTELKGIKGRERDLQLAKSNLNSCYGMMVTDIVKDEVIYNGDEWEVELADYDEKIKEYNESKSRFLFYPWGIWITSYCRRTILTAIYDEFKEDYIYSDTDSIKFKNVEKHLPFFEKFNEGVTAQVQEAMKKHRLSEDMAAPCNQNGVRKHIGHLEFECRYDKFKSLGAKRYLTETDGELSLTCSGLNPYEASIFLSQQKDPFECFNDNMYVPPEYTGKLTHTYIDDEMRGTIKDCNGVSYTYYEKSGVHLEAQEYSLSIGYAYAQFLKGVKTYYEIK